MSDFDIEALKKYGSQQAIRKAISSFNFEIQRSAENIIWDSKQPEVHIANIRKALENIEACFKKLEMDS